MFCSQSCYCFPIILDSVNEFVSAKTDPMIPVYEFLTWFSHARPAEPWPMVPLISVSLSLYFFWLTLLLAEAKGDMDLAASRGGSGTSFIPTKLFWIHGQAGILNFFNCSFQILSHWETTMIWWRYDESLRTSKQSVNWSSTANQYNRGSSNLMLRSCSNM